MEELSVKEFAERWELGEMQVRRILEHPDRYPWECYGIEHAYKFGGRWRIRLRDGSKAVEARGSAELIDRVAWLVSSFEESYPIHQVLADLQTLPIGQVMGNAVRRLPAPGEVGGRLAEVAKGGPPPHEVLLRLKTFFR